MQKAFSSSRSRAFAMRVGEKTFSLSKELPQKIKAVHFGCRKRFLRPEAVLLQCKWAKNVFFAKETATKNKSG